MSQKYRDIGWRSIQDAHIVEQRVLFNVISVIKFHVRMEKIITCKWCVNDMKNIVITT